MSSNTGYISLAVIGAVVLGVIGGGIYYAHGSGADTKLTPTGMGAYSGIRQGNSTGYYYGGRKTHRKKHSHKKTRRN
jgi:hypothetical protein